MERNGKEYSTWGNQHIQRSGSKEKLVCSGNSKRKGWRSVWNGEKCKQAQYGDTLRKTHQNRHILSDFKPRSDSLEVKYLSLCSLISYSDSLITWVLSFETMYPLLSDIQCPWDWFQKPHYSLISTCGGLQQLHILFLPQGCLQWACHCLL